MNNADSLLTREQVRQILAEVMPPEVFDTAGAADYVRMSTQNLELYRVNGGGPRYVKLGRLVRYRRAALDEWLVAHERAHTSEGA